MCVKRDKGEWDLIGHDKILGGCLGGFLCFSRGACEDVISRLGSHVSPSGESPPTNTTILKYWLYWAYVYPSSLPTSKTQHSHLYYLFFCFFSPYWPNRSRTIFQPAAFVSKQLYLVGYGLFSIALSILCYRLSLSFGSKPYGT